MSLESFATPNLPSRDYALTEIFYQALGFETTWHDTNWMIMESGGLMLEFFKYVDLDPLTGSFSCCLRLADLDSFYQLCLTAGIPENQTGFPRIHAPKLEHSGMTIGYLVDLDGTLLRLVQN